MSITEHMPERQPRRYVETIAQRFRRLVTAYNEDKEGARAEIRAEYLAPMVAWAREMAAIAFDDYFEHYWRLARGELGQEIIQQITNASNKEVIDFTAEADAIIRGTTPVQRDQYLRSHFITTIVSNQSKVERAKRTRMLGQKGKQRAAEIIRALEDGRKVVIPDYLHSLHLHVEANRQVQLGAMTYDDLFSSSRWYKNLARNNLLRARFLDMLRERIPQDGSTVNDHYTNEEIARMLAALEL